MGWFKGPAQAGGHGGAPGSHSGGLGLPDSIVEDLDAFGRHSIRPTEASTALSPRWLSLEPDLYPAALADPAQFCRGMRSVAELPGGWVAYGATRLIVSLLENTTPNADYDALMTVSMKFLRSRNISAAFLNEYEKTWWRQHQGAEEPWLTGRLAPTQETAQITLLCEGEQRRLANMGPGGNNKDILAARTPEGQFQAVIEGPNSGDDAHLAQFIWYSSPTLYELYLRVSESLGSPPYWCDPELAAFIPLPQPDFS